MGQAVLPAADLPVLFQRLSNGESLSTLASSYGITGEAVRQRLEKWATAGHGDKTYQEAITDFFVENAMQSKDRMVNASDALALARAREENKYWLWMLERRRPLQFGPKQQVQQDTSISITIQQLTPQPVVSGPMIIEAQNVSAQLLTDQQSQACEGPTTDGADKA